VEEWCKANDCSVSCMFEDRLEKSDKMRDEGNNLLKQDDFPGAEMRYYAAIYQVDFSMAQYGDDGKKYEAQLNERKMKILSNLCVARMQNRKFTECKAIAEVGLQFLKVANFDEATTKANEAKLWYLKGKANIERGFSEDALEDLKKAQALAPEDKAVRTALKNARGDTKKDKETSKEVWRNALLTSDEVLVQGPWWQPSVQLARLRERRRLKGCCGGRRQPASKRL